MTQPQPDILSQLASSLRDILLLVIGGLLGFLSSWVVSKRERKGARADQRRERIYGPLQDELNSISTILPKNEGTQQTSAEYPRIKSEHIRYMIPKQLRDKIVQLYEEVIPKYEKQRTTLGQKYSDLILAEITQRLAPIADVTGTATVQSASYPFLSTIASLGNWLAEGKIPNSLESEAERAFLSLKDHSRPFPQSTLQEFFDVWKKKLQQDPLFKKFVETKEKAMMLIREITSELSKDLESEN